MAYSSNKLIIIRPLCELHGRTERMEAVLSSAIEDAAFRGVELEIVEEVSALRPRMLVGARVVFAVCLSGAGVNMEYYRLLEYFRRNEGCLEGAVGGIVVDGASELYTKATARRIAFSANAAGCTFPGKPLVEATGSLGNFHVLSAIREKPPRDVYAEEVCRLFRKVICFEFSGAAASDGRSDEGSGLKLLTVHASSRTTSNSLLLWDKVRRNLESGFDITELSLRNGQLLDCRGCSYDQCRHYGERSGCFYGGIMVEQAFPAIISCDALVMVCPNYNDAVGANLTAFINRLTAVFRANDFSKKRIYALVVSGYSGGDIVAEQIIGAFNFNKEFILPGNFAMVETANDPKSILAVPDIDARAESFAAGMRRGR